jgi:hemolysin activation/secretion protein
MTKYSLRDNIQFVGFLEGGAVYTNDFKGAGSLQPIAGIRNYAAGAGAGVRFRLTKLLIGRFDVGFPLVKVPQGQRHHDFTLHFGLQSEPF